MTNGIAPIPDASWPDSLPHPEENEFLSLVLNSDSIQWSLHVRIDNHFRAQYWWKTNGIALPEKKEEIPLLKDLIPPCVHPIFMGNRQGLDAIKEWSMVKRIPYWTVYLLAVDRSLSDTTQVLQQIFRDIPCRLFALQWSDFFPQQSQTSQMPLNLLSSLKAVVMDGKQDPGSTPSVLLFDTKQSHLQYAACDGTKVLGYGVGPCLDTISSQGTKNIFSFTKQTYDVSSYFQILGIIKAWEQRCKGPKQTIWIEGKKAKLIHSFLLQTKGSRTSFAIEVMRDLVHFGVDAIIREQIQNHGELHEPMDRLCIGQRVKMETSLGTVMNRVRGDKDESMLDYKYNVEVDEGKRQQVLSVQEVIDSIRCFVKHLREENPSIPVDSQNEYEKNLGHKIVMAESALDLFDKELKRLNLVVARVDTDATPPPPPPPLLSPSPTLTPTSHPIVNDNIVKSTTKKTTKRQAAEEADPETPHKRSYIGRRVAKYFGKELYFGTIASWDPAAIVDDKLDLWRVEYDDGDSEDFELFEVEEGQKLYQQEKKRDPKLK